METKKVELKEIFSADARSIFQILGQSNVGYYIPAYQREYTWNKEKVERLFEDSSQGLKYLETKNDSITFLGSIIVIHDTEYRTVEPSIQGELPARVMLVIDGQQRLSTFALIMCALHNYFRPLSKFLKSKKDDHLAFDWMRKQLITLQNNLENSCRNDMNYSDDEDEFQYYPKIARGLEDSWARSKNNSNYSSPIAEYIFEYVKHIQLNPSEPFKFTPKINSERYSVVPTNIKTINDCIKVISEGGNENIVFPRIHELAKSQTIQLTLFGTELPSNVVDILVLDEVNKDEKKFREIFRVLVFSLFLLNRVAMTVVTAKNEDYAFDMFEALNTTGEPLTSFETFKPEIIKTEGHRLYEKSPSMNCVVNIQNYLNQFLKAEDRQKETTNLLIAFRLAESGIKLGSKLTEQRKYLRESYGTFKDIEGKRAFLKSMSDTADFFSTLWPTKKKKNAIMPDGKLIEDKEAELCLHLLRQADHKITKGLLIRFYSEYLGDNKGKYEDFYSAIKVITAFYVLWRSSRRTTENIDSHYRTILEKGVPSLNIPSFSRVNSDNLPTLNSLRRALLHTLKEKGDIHDSDSWVSKVKSLDIYNVSSVLSKFLIFLAHKNSKPLIDDQYNGLIQPTRQPLIEPIMTIKNWESLTIEHVAPQTPKFQGWAPDIYEVDSDTPNTLGNLTLIPQLENSSIGNGSQTEKALFYTCLATDTDEEQERLLANLMNEHNLELSQSSIDIIRGSKIQPFLKPFGDFQHPWNRESIIKRSTNLAAVSYDTLSKWLSPD